MLNSAVVATKITFTSKKERLVESLVTFVFGKTEPDILSQAGVAWP